MHILILPSWYPENDDDFRGSFFREQAIALAETGAKVGVVAQQFRSLRELMKPNRYRAKPSVQNEHGVSTWRRWSMNWVPRVDGLLARRWEKLSNQLADDYIASEGVPDIVLVQGAIFAGATALHLKAKYNVPYAVIEHSSQFYDMTLPAVRHKLLKRVVNGAGAFAAVSAALASQMKKHAMTDQDWAVVPNSVHPNFLQNPIKKRSANKITFLSVCNLFPVKRLDILLDAFASAFAGNNDVALRICGTGYLRQSLEQKSAALGIDTQVNFLGKKSRDEVAQEMSNADIFVISSEFETFSVVAVEALASGLPVISTMCGGPQDIVTEECGFLIPKNDSDAMAVALKKMAMTLSEFDAEEIRQSCRKRFDQRVIAEKQLALLSSVRNYVGSSE